MGFHSITLIFSTWLTAGTGRSLSCIYIHCAPRRSIFKPVACHITRLATALQVNPQRDIIGAVDLEAFVDGLPEQDQTLLEMRMAGAKLKETAEKVGLSISTVFARLKALSAPSSGQEGPSAVQSPSMVGFSVVAQQTPRTRIFRPPSSST